MGDDSLDKDRVCRCFLRVRLQFFIIEIVFFTIFLQTILSVLLTCKIRNDFKCSYLGFNNGFYLINSFVVFVLI